MSSPALPPLPQELLLYPQNIPYIGGLEPVEEYPDRVFVGGFSDNINEDDLSRFFEQWVQVREAKILREEGKRGFGFLTLKSEKEAMILRNLTPEKLMCNGQRLNIGPARKRIGISQKKPYPCEGFGIVTSSGYHPPGTFTFCLDKAPYFLPRSPSTKTQLPVSPEATFLHTIGQSLSAQSISPITSEHEVPSITEDKLGVREANNNTQLATQNILMDPLYAPLLYVPLNIPFMSPTFQVPFQQTRLYPLYKELHEGSSMKPFYTS